MVTRQATLPERTGNQITWVNLRLTSVRPRFAGRSIDGVGPERDIWPGERRQRVSRQEG
jgi:hypothetical protein